MPASGRKQRDSDLLYLVGFDLGDRIGLEASRPFFVVNNANAAAPTIAVERLAGVANIARKRFVDTAADLVTGRHHVVGVAVRGTAVADTAGSDPLVFGNEMQEKAESARKKASDIELIIAKLRDSLDQLRIKIKRKPDHSNPLGLNEQCLDDVISAEITYSNQRAKEHDIDSLTAVHRLRRGATYHDVEYCKAIFVTTNGNLARAALKFFKSEYDQATVPLCVPTTFSRPSCG